MASWFSLADLWVDTRGRCGFKNHRLNGSIDSSIDSFSPCNYRFTINRPMLSSKPPWRFTDSMLSLLLRFAAARREPPRAAGSERLWADGQAEQEARPAAAAAAQSPMTPAAPGRRNYRRQSHRLWLLESSAFLAEFRSNKELLTSCLCVKKIRIINHPVCLFVSINLSVWSICLIYSTWFDDKPYKTPLLIH